MIIRGKGEVLLQKRSKNVEHWPGRWDISAAGHIPTGETPEQAAIRELEEETGLKAKVSDLIRIGTWKFSVHVPEINFHNNEIDYVFLLRFDGDVSEIKMLDGELEQVKFISLGKFEEEIESPDFHEKYVPHEKAYLHDIIKAIKEQLK